MELPKEVRPSVVRMARHMEAQLRANDSRGGWQNCTKEYLEERIEQNLKDLRACSGSEGGFESFLSTHIQRTCADIANFAMMLSENEYLHNSADLNRGK